MRINHNATSPLRGKMKSKPKRHGKFKHGSVPANKITLPEKALRELYLQYGSKKISSILGVSSQTVLRNLHDYGVEIRKSGAPSVMPDYWKQALRKKRSVPSYLKGKTKENCEVLARVSNSLIGEKNYRWKPELHTNEMIECACGCGELIHKRDKKGRLIYYKKGHCKDEHFEVGSVPWNRGKLYGKYKGLLNKIKQSSKYRQWRLVIYERDEYKCQTCGSKKEIRAHHKTTMKELYYAFLDQYKTLDTKQLYKQSKEYSPFWKVDNGITVCHECHKVLHGWS